MTSPLDSPIESGNDKLVGRVMTDLTGRDNFLFCHTPSVILRLDRSIQFVFFNLNAKEG